MTKIKTHTCRAGSMGRGVYSRSWISWTLSDEWSILYYVTVCRTNINSYLLQPISLMNAKYNLRSEFTHCITSLETKIQKACVGPLSESEQTCEVNEPSRGQWRVLWLLIKCALCAGPRENPCHNMGLDMQWVSGGIRPLPIQVFKINGNSIPIP